MHVAHAPVPRDAGHACMAPAGARRRLKLRWIRTLNILSTYKLIKSKFKSMSTRGNPGHRLGAQPRGSLAKQARTLYRGSRPGRLLPAVNLNVHLFISEYVSLACLIACMRKQACFANCFIICLYMDFNDKIPRARHTCGRARPRVLAIL